jgi:molecular chaperone GrpE
MEQNGREQQESSRLQQAAEQQEPGGEPNAATESAQVEQGPGAEQQKMEECMDLLRRTQADFVNYRRRMNQEQAEGRIVAQSALLAQVLPVLDDLRRALSEVPPELASHPWVQGVSLVARQIATLFEQLGVRQIGAPGERFDPRWHEAIATEMQSDVPEGAVLRVARPGYVIGERIIRPAQVVVARAPAAVSGAQEQHGDASTR